MQELAPRFADGAVFVPLEDVATPASSAAASRARSGAGCAGRGRPVEQVDRALREQQLLLVLDNFEQLVAGAPHARDAAAAAARG